MKRTYPCITDAQRWASPLLAGVLDKLRGALVDIETVLDEEEKNAG